MSVTRGDDAEAYAAMVHLYADGVEVTDAEKTVTVDRSGLARRFNVELGEQRSRPLPKGLSHLRIFIDRSSVEIFVNDGDAVFSSRIFPTEGEDRLYVQGDSSIHLWELSRAVEETFAVD